MDRTKRPTRRAIRMLATSAYVVDGMCVLRYENELGKGDHRHFGATGSEYAFRTPEALIAGFERGIARWNREDSDSRGPSAGRSALRVRASVARRQGSAFSANQLRFA